MQWGTEREAATLQLVRRERIGRANRMGKWFFKIYDALARLDFLQTLFRWFRRGGPVAIYPSNASPPQKRSV